MCLAFYHGSVSSPRGVAVRALAVVVVVATACSSSNGGSIPTAPVPAVNAATASLLPTTADALPSLDPAAFASLLEDLKGTPVVVNFWASWCSPCRAEAPLLREAHERYGKRVQFLGVDIEDARDGAERFIHDQDLAYPSVFDPTNAIGLHYDLASPPATLFFDSGGDLVATVPGQLVDAALERNLRAVASTGE
jgi:cytochrome c biogenesis protein CcmG, thiol:disulfide interchange protein DsbE